MANTTGIRQVLLIGCAENGALLLEKARKCDINKQKTFRLRESHGMFYLLSSNITAYS